MKTYCTCSYCHKKELSDAAKKVKRLRDELARDILLCKSLIKKAKKRCQR